MTEAEVEAINAEASVLMKRGIAFLDEPRREAAIDALHCFDEALELRRRVPPDHSPFQVLSARRVPVQSRRRARAA